MDEKQSGKQATLNSVKALKSRSRDINFCEDLSMTAEEFSQHRFDGSFCTIWYITAVNISFSMGAMLYVWQNGSHLSQVIKEKELSIILWSHQEEDF